MRFPNAAKGMKKIFSAQVMSLIGTLLLIAALVLGVIGVATGQIGGELDLEVAGFELIGALAFAAAWLILSFIAFIVNLVGIFNASRDESNFKNAWFFLALSILMAMIAGAFAPVNGMGMFSSLMYTLSSLLNLFVTLFIISGGVKLADQMNRGDVSALGSNVLKLIVVVKVIELIVCLISSFMGGMAASVVAGILAIVAIALSVIQYFMYLVFLNKAKKMLNE